MKFLVPITQHLLEYGLLSDGILRWGMRQLLRQKLCDESVGGIEGERERLMRFIEEMKSAPVAINTKDANEQHYELPTEFFKLCLGRNLKYSSCYYTPDIKSLDDAEDLMLSMTVKRAELEDGQRILELGCGWGSLSLYMASRFPKAHITGVSNSKSQKAYIDEQAKLRGITNLKIITCDMNAFDLNEQFDRIVSVEMFEHMRNWQQLLHKVAKLLKVDGKFFIHIFTHKDYAYPYVTTDASDFIGKYFFTGGMMPSDDLILYFQDHLKIDRHWRVSGIHYSKTAEDWLLNMDQNQEKIMPIFQEVYGKEYVKWWHYWRIFYMACAELWGYEGGRQWMVSHYLFSKR